MRKLALFSLVLLGGCNPAAADGCNPRLQDCSRISGASAYSYSVKPAHMRVRRGSNCGRDIPARECSEYIRRFQEGLRSENARRARKLARKSRPIREARQEYRDERGRRVIIVDDSSRGPRRRDGDDGRECKKRITITSKPMATEGRACNEARKLWSMQAIEQHGGKYGRVELARGVRSDPHAAHEGAWRDVCTFSAIPCRSVED